MPMPGGPSDKIGNRYEALWTVSTLMKVLDRSVNSIRLEDPNSFNAEFVVYSRNHKEFHQAKLSTVDGKWSYKALKKVKVLNSIYNELIEDKNAKYIFVSGCDAPELKEMSDRIRNSESYKEFNHKFLTSEKHKKFFDFLKEVWKTDSLTVYDLIGRVEVVVMNERALENYVLEQLRARFLCNSNKVLDSILRLITDSTHHRISYDVIVKYLNDKGFFLRKLKSPDDAFSLVEDATTRYLDSTKRFLIKKSLIPRSSTEEIINNIESSYSTEVCDFVVIGKAGGGKTGCIIECVENLQSRDNSFAVLAFRLDRLKDVTSTKELGEHLGLEESPSLVLEAAANSISGEAVLVIDQLDALSTTSGRISSSFDVVEDLLKEIRGLQGNVRFHVIVVCREFDLRNDHIFNRLFNNKIEISVDDFSLDEVKLLLKNAGFNIDKFNEKQFNILCLPQNLSLFFSINEDPEIFDDFQSVNDLFNHYWDKKRNDVNNRASGDYWGEIIQFLCNEMTNSQKLSIPKEKMDIFPSGYLFQIVSEGVLSFDGKRYGFGHETFFDYCFSRYFITEENSLVSFLVSKEQHLFRRSQVRQVLTYLREADRERYNRELKELFQDDRVRYHLKDLALSFLFSLPNPKEDEWCLISQYIESEVEAIKSGESNSDKFSSLVWRHLRISNSWFNFVYDKGLIENWLSSKNSHLIDTAIDYLKCHQRHSGTIVAELLEPFSSEGGEWIYRLGYVIRWSDLGYSRRFFELFLKLLANGTLDEVVGPIAVNSTFWDISYGLDKTQPGWVAELIATWLRRQFEIFKNSCDDDNKIFNLHNDSCSKMIRNAANNAPHEFLYHVLPVILEISSESCLNEIELPKKDPFFGYIIYGDCYSICSTCSESVALAIEKVIISDPFKIDSVIEELRDYDTFIANFLLLRSYSAGCEHYADMAAADILNDVWRFDCGYSDNSYWIAISLIGLIFPYCSNENRLRLEEAILNYMPSYELGYGQLNALNEPNKHNSKGRACFNLLSKIPAGLLSCNALKRFKELERKFASVDDPPQVIQVYSVGSPIERSSAEKMTDDQWLIAIEEYGSEERKNRFESPEKGGAWELAGLYEEFVKQNPKRFASLCLEFPFGTHPSYMKRTLRGLEDVECSVELKFNVCRKAYNEYKYDCGTEIADLLGSIKEILPRDIVEMLNWLSTSHPDPCEDLNNEIDISDQSPEWGITNAGINTTRGRTALAIRNLIKQNKLYIDVFRPSIEHLVNDKCSSVQTCAISILVYILEHDSEFAINQFMSIFNPTEDRHFDDRLLSSPDTSNFIYYGLKDYFGSLEFLIERMVESDISDANELGAMTASLAFLHGHIKAEKYVNKSLSGNKSHRLGIAKIASANIGNEMCMEWAKQKLMILFNDEDKEVLQTSSECFRNLREQSLEPYRDLIVSFCDSLAYQECSSCILRTLEISSHQLPDITYIICKKFLYRFIDEANDIRTSRAADLSDVSELVLRSYHQNQNNELSCKYLDLIDMMCLEKCNYIDEELKKYERC